MNNNFPLLSLVEPLTPLLLFHSLVPFSLFIPFSLLLFSRLFFPFTTNLSALFTPSSLSPPTLSNSWVKPAIIAGES